MTTWVWWWYRLARPSLVETNHSGTRCETAQCPALRCRRMFQETCISRSRRPSRSASHSRKFTTSGKSWARAPSPSSRRALTNAPARSSPLRSLQRPSSRARMSWRSSTRYPFSRTCDIGTSFACRMCTTTLSFTTLSRRSCLVASSSTGSSPSPSTTKRRRGTCASSSSTLCGTATFGTSPIATSSRRTSFFLARTTTPR
mmetsp:Transcript_10832/g.32068  ORF Transcript_10832/g.32068 Transcript_10832/m.32068 type:complete len:201 (-) Transcript_10832:1061-1663(-)